MLAMSGADLQAQNKNNETPSGKGKKPQNFLSYMFECVHQLRALGLVDESMGSLIDNVFFMFAFQTFVKTLRFVSESSNWNRNKRVNVWRRHNVDEFVDHKVIILGKLFAWNFGHSPILHMNMWKKRVKQINYHWQSCSAIFHWLYFSFKTKICHVHS